MTDAKVCSTGQRKTRQLYHMLALLVVGGLFILIAAVVQPFAGTNLRLTDQLFMPEAPSPNIAIAGIDDATLQDYGKWSEWPRRLHAQAINNLSEAGARVIAMDILFVDRSSDDKVLAEAIENAGNVVLSLAGIDPLSTAGPSVAYADMLFPAEPLAGVMRSTGHANINPDPDGRVRNIPLVIRDAAGNEYPALSLSALHSLFSMPLPAEYEVEDNSLNLLSRKIPVDDSYRLNVNFAIDTGKYPYVSYGDAISGDFDRSLVKGKIVVVGMAATGELDMWDVPGSGSKMPGLLIHAAAMDTILRQNYVTYAADGTTNAVLALFVLLAALALPRLRIKWGVLLVGGLFAGYLATIFVSFDRGFVLNVFYPLSLLPVMFVTSVVCMILIEQSDKRKVRDLFGRYVSPQVAKEILRMSDCDQLRLGGETREVTVLFADMRDFTRMSEQMSPQAIVALLNTHLSIIIDSVLRNEGMVNKFAGDNIMAVWNAPQSQPDHARLALKAALEAQEALAAVPSSDPSAPRVQFGIGINTGNALAGNIGCSGRVEYTVIGDSVNLASRICGATAGGEVWAGPETYRQAQDGFEFEEKEPQKLKGKAEPMKLYRVIGLKGEPPQNQGTA